VTGPATRGSARHPAGPGTNGSPPFRRGLPGAGHLGVGVGGGTGNVVAPSREDPVARAASEVVGGPAGRRLASGAGLWRAASVLVALSVLVLALGVVQKQHCRAQGWTTPDQFWHACYSDIPVLFGSAALGGPDRPSLTDATGPAGLGQPPLASAAMWVVAGLVPDDARDPARTFFDTSVLALAALLTVAVTAIAVAAGRRRFDAAHLALAPVLVTAGLISYQLLSVALLALALAAWQRGRPGLGGLCLGLAAAAAPPPAVAVVALAAVVVTWRSSRRGDAFAFAAAGLVAWFVVRVLLLPGLTGALGDAWRGWREAPPGYGSLWLTPQLLSASAPRRDRWWWPFDGTESLSGSTASALSLATLVLFVGTLVVAAVRRQSLPGGALPLPRLALSLMAGVLVLSTSLPVQVSLLLLPLIALSGLPWRDHLVWAGTELVYFVGVWLYIAAQSDPNRGLPAGFYLVFLLARLAGIAWLGIQAWRAPLPPGLAVTPDPHERDGDGREPVDPVDRTPFAPELWTTSMTTPERR
jgi:hypothetical protein